MAQIFQLSSTDALIASDLLAIYSTNNWDARKVSLGNLLAFFQSAFAAPNVAVQPSTPGTGATIAIASGNTSTWALIQPAGTIATLAITLPLNTSALDGAEVLVSSTQQITALTVNLNGATSIYGAPSNLGAGASFRLRFYQPYNSWYKIA